MVAAGQEFGHGIIGRHENGFCDAAADDGAAVEIPHLSGGEIVRRNGEDLCQEKGYDDGPGRNCALESRMTIGCQFMSS